MAKTLHHIIIALFMLFAMPMTSMAQSATDLYQQGVSLYNSGQYAAAKSKFQQSIFVDGSAKNKAKCNAMIGKCDNPPKEKDNKTKTKQQGNNSYSRGGTSRYVSEGDYSVETTIEAHQNKPYEKILDFSDSLFEAKIQGNTPWLHLQKGKGKVYVTCDDNNTDTERRASYEIHHDGVKYVYKIKQLKGDGSFIARSDYSYNGTIRDMVIVPANELYYLYIGAKDKKLPKNPKVIKASSWIEQKDYKFVKSKNFWKRVTGQKESVRVGNHELSLMLEKYTVGTEPYRDGYVEIEGWGVLKIQQEKTVQQ